jgi:hypothetical protein
MTRKAVPHVAKEVVHLGHAVMAQRAKDGRLALEQLVGFPVGGATPIEYLDRERSVIRAIAREEGATERAVADLPNELVPAGDRWTGWITEERHGGRIRERLSGGNG